MKVYTSTSIDIQKNANIIKESILQTLAGEGYLEEEQAAEFCRLYCVIVYEKGWLGTLMDNFLGNKDSNSLKSRVVKLTKQMLLETDTTASKPDLSP